MKKALFMFIVAVTYGIAAAVNPSGTMPIIYINTTGNQEITSTEEYITATFYIDALNTGYNSLGTKDAPIDLNIRGRGNYTWWGFDKKPYRLKLPLGQKMLGMTKSKHWVLLANADDNLGYMRMPMGFALSQYFELNYTPDYVPAELVLNGDYKGIYFLCENVRVDKDRVCINEQLDGETDPTAITGGWLLEINNYEEPSQIVLTEGNGEIMRVTYHKPEVLSTEQETYISQLLSKTNDAIYANDKQSTEWENYIDMDTLARYYIVQEIMDDAESFHGSCYMHKSLGSDTKLVFGPVWDFGNSFQRGHDLFIYQWPPYGQTWIGEIAKFPRFQQKVKDLWANYKGNLNNYINMVVDNWGTTIGGAAAADAQRWPNYGTSNLSSKQSTMLTNLREKIGWLDSQWSNGGVANLSQSTLSLCSYGNGSFSTSADIAQAQAYSLSGQTVNTSFTDHTVDVNASAGIYLLKIVDKNGNKYVNKIIIK